jgi:hypothetical protein
VRIACFTHSSLMTGSMPGIAASTSETLALGSAPNSVEAPEKSFAREVTWAWISIPMMISQSPVAPGMSRLGSGVRVSMIVMGRAVGFPEGLRCRQNGDIWETEITAFHDRGKRKGFQAMPVCAMSAARRWSFDVYPAGDLLKP